MERLAWVSLALLAAVIFTEMEKTGHDTAVRIQSAETDRKVARVEQSLQILDTRQSALFDLGKKSGEKTESVGDARQPQGLFTP